MIVLAIAALLKTTDQINVSERSMKVSNRPYLVMDKIEFDNSFVVTNYGKTPSFNTKIYYSTAIDTGNDFVPSETFSDSIVTHSTIGNKAWIPMNDAKNRQWPYSDSAYCDGKIVYSDVFDGRYGYKFCFRRERESWSKYKNYNYPFEVE